VDWICLAWDRDRDRDRDRDMDRDRDIADHYSDSKRQNTVTDELILRLQTGVDKKNQLDVTFCILYFSCNSCLTCFGQLCAHHQELTTG